MSYLVIVESPAKANTIKSYLGSNYKVIASKGHIRDLPKSSLGIDVEDGFKPHYINIRGKGDVIKELKREAKSATKVFLATDPDREGEAISWHIASVLGIPMDRPCRVTFNEITKSAVKEAIKNPRTINEDLVNSQQARRILDRLVGFNLSELLWKTVKSGLSGGRVQSVAARIITEREEDIRAFVPKEYWTVDAELLTNGGESFSVRYHGDSKGKKRICSKSESDAILATLNNTFKVVKVKHTQKKRAPEPPFTTSTLQQEASKRLGFQAQKIMRVAQELYDGLNLGHELGGVQGLITYMRTDSLRIADSARDAARDFIKSSFGESALSKSARSYKSGENSQDAHEAIRPSNVNITPSLVSKLLTSDQYKLYKLIWERFVASQMASCVLDTVSVDLTSGAHLFKAGGYVIKSKGFLSVYDGEEYGEGSGEEDSKLSKLPEVLEGDLLKVKGIGAEQHFTEPPARYTEASLIKFLEENGIGRPSTYAPIISIITSREYVKRDGKSLVATPLGEITTNFMKENFPEIIDYEFTASMEDKLDSIENKENDIIGVISDFYKKFVEELKVANEKAADGEKIAVPEEESGVKCELCGAEMVVKNGRFGKFLACPSYPACRNTKALDKDGNVVENKPAVPKFADFKCEKCGGNMVERNGRYGSFYACESYPKCTFTKQKVTETGAFCPDCGSKIMARHGKGKSLFYSCLGFPECDFSTWDTPLKEKCPDCDSNLFYRKSRKTVICKNKSCDYKREEEMTVGD